MLICCRNLYIQPIILYINISGCCQLIKTLRKDLEGARGKHDALEKAEREARVTLDTKTKKVKYFQITLCEAFQFDFKKIIS